MPNARVRIDPPDEKVTSSANVKIFKLAVTVRDVSPILSERSMRTTSLTVYIGQGDIRSQEGKPARRLFRNTRKV